MLFKTRVGLVVLSGPSEILVVKHAKIKVWVIYVKTPRSSPQLAFFSDGSGAKKSVAACMAKIEAAIRTKADFCDLSRVGDPKAWRRGSSQWVQIQWPRTEIKSNK